MSAIKEFSADKLSVKVYADRAAMGAEAARMCCEKIRQLLAQKDQVNMIFAAAPSQNEFLAGLVAAKDIDWSRVNAFHMDEYVGLASDAPQGFANFLKRGLFDLLPFGSVHLLDGNAPDIAAECARYTKLLRDNPTDITCAGIGENGHLAFNDPPVADFSDPAAVKVVELDPVCRQQQVNDGCFASLDLVPTHALTLTIPSLLAAPYFFCMVPAATKTEAVTRTVNEAVSTACPATVLRTKEGAILFVDSDSGANLL